MKRELQHIDIPGEYDARRRTWDTVRAAYAEREPVPWPRRHARGLAFAGAAAALVAALVAAALTPPGRSVVNSVRRTIGVQHAQRELVRLPAPGRLLIDSARGAWIVQSDGSRRLLGPYHDPTWSPHGLFVAAVSNRRELVALDPKGNVRWVKPVRRVVRSPRWSYEGYRIAYLAGPTLRVINGDGTGDRLIGPADPAVPPAWRPGTHEVAYVARGRPQVVDVDTLRRLRADRADRTRLFAAVPPGRGRAARLETRRGRSFVVVGSQQVFSGAGRFSGVAWSPNGKWLAVSWPGADQLVFVRVRGMPKLIAVSNVARQLGSSASLAGWSR
jgi:hypothetical protein